MRKTISINTYQKIKELFSKNPEKKFSIINIRDNMKIDYHSVVFALETLIKEGHVVMRKGGYKLKKKLSEK